jgi:hypothetical protein
MKHVLVFLAAVCLVVPAAALGKGPSAATMDGPGGGGGITFGGAEGSGPLTALTEQSGFFPAVFRQQPDPMLDSRPNGELGPKYTITYTVPGGNNDVWTIRQDVYPYATPTPVTHMAPGQEIFETEGTRGGWFQAGPELKTTLVEAGLPASPSAGSAGGSDFPTAPVSVLAFALLIVCATAVLLRRRARPAAA